MRRGGWELCAAAGLLLAPFFAQAAARDWTLVDLGTLGGAGSYGAAISNGGFVAGCADTGPGVAHAFIYDGTAMRDLEPDASTGSGCALAVNDAGQAAGRSATGGLVVWNGTSVTRLGVNGTVGAIDAHGVVVGAYNEGTFARAFRYESGALTPLAPAGMPSAATAINARGQVAGSIDNRAVIFENGSIRELGTLGGSASTARGINDGGVAVGTASDANSRPQAFVFDGVMRALPAPSYSGAVAINNAGQVVGSAEGTYGYLIEGDTYTRLDTLPAVVQKGWRFLEPTGINDRGWIVGTATTPSGDLRAFILRPTDRAAAANGLQRGSPQAVAALARSTR